jgi:hypothetical protein
MSSDQRATGIAMMNIEQMLRISPAMLDEGETESSG